MTLQNVATFPEKSIIASAREIAVFAGAGTPAKLLTTPSLATEQIEEMTNGSVNLKLRNVENGSSRMKDVLEQNEDHIIRFYENPARTRLGLPARAGVSDDGR